MWLRSRDVAGVGETECNSIKAKGLLAYYRLFKMAQLLDIMGFHSVHIKHASRFSSDP